MKNLLNNFRLEWLKKKLSLIEFVILFYREKCDSAYHPSCTCKMGESSDNMAVVDNQTRVIGLDNIRVIDSSIMPSVISGYN